MKCFLNKKKAGAAVLLLIFSLSFLSAAEVNLNLFFYKQEIKDSLKEMTDAFTARYPDIKIDLEMVPNDSQTVLKTKMQKNEAPDIIQLQGYANVFEFAESGWLLDITKEPVIKKVSKAAMNAVTYNGRVYALPMDLAGIGIIYNKEIFAKYNLKAPKTFKDLVKVSKVLKENGITPFAGLFKANWSLGHFLTMVHTGLAGDKLMPWLNGMNNGKGSYADPVNVNSIFRLLDFYKANAHENAAEYDWDQQQAEFSQGKAAMMIQGLWSYKPAVTANPALKCGFVPFPVSNKSSEVKLYADTDSTFAISSTSSPEKIAAAKTFLAWLATPEAIKMWVEKCKLVPTFKGANVKSMDEPFQVLLKYVSSGKPMPWAFSMYPVAVFEDACKNGAQEYIFGKKNPDQVITYIDSLWKKSVQ